MWFLIKQPLFWMLVSFVLGWLAHWFFQSEYQSPFESTRKEATTDQQNTPSNIRADSNETKPADASTGSKPNTVDGAPTRPDDLKKIKGIGPVNEQALNKLGIYLYSQIAEWSDDNITWVEHYLSFSGRIKREDWIGQAKALAKL